MIGRDPLDGGPWHLSVENDRRDTLCGAPVAGVMRDPHKIDKYGGACCPKCWAEWHLRHAASLARQDQWEAAR